MKGKASKLREAKEFWKLRWTLGGGEVANWPAFAMTNSTILPYNYYDTSSGFSAVLHAQREKHLNGLRIIGNA